MDENVVDVRASVAGFRQRLIEDAPFRQAFATDPEGTLRACGISVPAGTVIGPLDAASLEQRVGRLKAALGDDLSALYGADAGNGQRLRDLMSDARRQSIELHEAELAVVAGGDHRAAEGQVTYTISAFGTLDW
jgi:hypothetical protein